MRSFFKKSVRSRERAGAEVSMVKHIAYGVFTITVVALLIVSFWYMSRLPVLTISSVVVEGGETISTEEIESLVSESLSGSYVLIVPRRHVYFYPEAEIKERILRIPRIHTVDISREGTVLTVRFEEYEPSALWCKTRGELDGCYFVSKDGYAFTTAPPLRGNTLVRHYSENRTPEETQFLDAATLERTEQFRELVLREFGYTLDEMTHAENGDITYHIMGGGDFITAASVSSAESFENLKTILRSEEFAHLAPGNFQYIDLRFGLKVYVREREVEVTDNLSSTTLPSATSSEQSVTDLEN